MPRPCRSIRERPLLIVDADEVLLRFAEGFDRFLQPRGALSRSSSAIACTAMSGAEDETALLDVEVSGCSTNSAAISIRWKPSTMRWT
jgi:formylmethanofuran dehydrogenase subunit E